MHVDLVRFLDLLLPLLARMSSAFPVQVYGIISAQLVLTAIVAATILAVPPVRGFVTTSLWFQITCAVLPLVGMLFSLATSANHDLQSKCAGLAVLLIQEILSLRIADAGLIPLYIYSRKHPQNLIILALWVSPVFFLS